MKAKITVIPTVCVVTEISRDSDVMTLHIYRVLPSGEVVIGRVAAEVSERKDDMRN